MKKISRYSVVDPSARPVVSDVENIAGLIVETPGTCGGRPRVVGHRITVEGAEFVDRMERENGPSLSSTFARR